MIDPATGRLIAPDKSAKDERVPLETAACTGQICPENGLWTVQQFADVSYHATRSVRKDKTMPQFVKNDPRPIPGLDALLGMRKHRSDREWTLKAYTDQT